MFEEDRSSLVAVAQPEGPSPPVLRTPVLMCAGKCRQPTIHKFVVNRRAGEMGSYEQVYGCTLCNTERRYGLLG